MMLLVEDRGGWFTASRRTSDRGKVTESRRSKMNAWSTSPCTIPNSTPTPTRSFQGGPWMRGRPVNALRRAAWNRPTGVSNSNDAVVALISISARSAEAWQGNCAGESTSTHSATTKTRPSLKYLCKQSTWNNSKIRRWLCRKKPFSRKRIRLTRSASTGR